MSTQTRLHAGPTPLWQQVVALIQRHIERGLWPIDHQIPSERELCEQYGISRTTVRLALAQAVNAGLLSRIHGRGTFVAPPKITQPLQQVTSFAETLLARGMEPATRLLQVQQQAADVATAHALGLHAGDQVVSIHLLGLGGGEPMALYHSVVPVHFGLLIREHMEHQRGTHQMVNELLAQFHGWPHMRSEQTFEAALASTEEARLLRLPGKAPLFVLTSLFQNPAGQAVEFRRARYRADKYQFHVTRQMEFKRGEPQT